MSGRFDMAAARMCTHGTSESRVPHGEVHPTWETLLLSRYYVPYIVTNLGDTHAHLKHPPHPERERHSRMGVKSEGGRTKRLCCLLGGRAATLRGSKLAKGS